MEIVFQNRIKKYDSKIESLFNELYQCIEKSVSCTVEKKLWASLPSFYVGVNFIRLIPFNDHINIEAVSLKKHQSELEGYKMTPKGMLQIYSNQQIPYEVLNNVFYETLMEDVSIP